ncbi:hypothetical protein DFH28DRAFT_453203 [Melampsora americana]|nr:hypothetical protein DFH28DRAFT_453203 [Melampsora americana]
MDFQFPLIYVLLLLKIPFPGHTMWLSTPEKLKFGTLNDLHQPITPSLKSISPLNLGSEKQELSTHDSSPSCLVEEFNRILFLSNTYIKTPIRLYQCLKDPESRIWRHIPGSLDVKGFYKTAFDPGYAFDETIKTACMLLEEGYLKDKERVWVLSVLKHLQKYLPQGHLKPMRIESIQWPLRGAALQLHLTKEIDLLDSSRIFGHASKSLSLYRLTHHWLRLSLELRLSIG